MKQRLLWVRLAVLFAWSMSTAVATAQDTIAALGFVPVTSAPPVYVGDGQEGQPSQCQCQGQRGQGDENTTRGPMAESMRRMCETIGRPITNCLNNKGLGCCATHNSFGCTSLYAQCTFIFGSCRQFFSEPCQPPPYGQPMGAACGCGR
jgi:hypothetical protein